MITDPLASPDVGAVDAQNPWPGLEAFQEEDQKYFHGRDMEIAELHRLVLRERLSVLFGVSGLGKTSLLQAGLFPILRDEHILPVRIRLNYSEGMPPLASQIKEAITDQASLAHVEVPSLEGTLWEAFHREHADFWSARNRVVTPLLVFDQFEEIFTRGHETPERGADTEALLVELADLIEGRAPAAVKSQIDANPDESDAFTFHRHQYKVLLSLREDFLADLESLGHRLIPSVMHNRLRLGPLNGEQALSAVLKAGGHLIAEDVAARVVRFVGAENADGRTKLADLEIEPALLSVFCRELNLTRIERREPAISAELLEGRQSEILTSFYERGLGGIGPAMRAFIEDRLVTVGGRRNSEPVEEALQKPGVTERDISLLVNRRLLRVEERAGMPWLELTHDRLTGVVRASRENRRQREEQEAAEAAEREALEKEEATRRELQKKTRTLRLVRGLLAAAVVGLIAAVAGAFFGIREQRRAEAAAAAAGEALADSRFEAAKDLVEHDETAEALPYLASALRLSPEQLPIQAYTASLLAGRNWPLPLRTIRGAAEFEAVDVSPDGKLMVTAARDGKAQVWEVETGDPRGPPLIHQGVVTTVGFSGDGRLILTASEDGTATLWGTDTGRPVAGPFHHAEAVSWAGLTRDGTRLMTVSADGAATVWAVATGKVLFELREGRENVTVARFSRDGNFAVTGTLNGLARVWDTRTGTLVATLTGHDTTARIDDAQFSPDGQRVVTTATDHTARVWDVRTARPIGKTIQHMDVVWDADFSPDGRLVATASDDGTVGIWSADTGEPTAPPMQHGSPVYTIEFSRDGRRIVTTSADYSARVWDVVTGLPLTERMPHGDWLEAAFSSDANRVITVSWDKTARVWDVRPSASVAEPMQHAAQVASAQFSPKNDYVLTVADDHTARIWDARTLRPVGAPMPHGADVVHAEFSPDESRVMTITRDGVATVWSGENWTRGQPIDAPKSMGFSADWTRALTRTSDRVVAIWNTQAHRPIGAPLTHESNVVSAAISPDARRAVTVMEDGQARLWDAADGRPVGAPLTDRGGISFARFSPDGRRLITAAKENTARVWDAETGGALGQPLRHYDWVTLAEFNRDGSRAVTASRNMAFIWNVDTGEMVGQPMRHQTDVLSVHFSRDGRMIVTASKDRTARVWDATTGEPESEPLHHNGPVRYAEFSANGDRVVTASDDDTARVWDVMSGSQADAGLFAALSEAIGGAVLSQHGIAMPVSDSIERIATLRQGTANATGHGAPAFLRWFLADRASRPERPWAEGR